MSSATTVTVLGTGAMGHPIATRLADRSYHVRAWNRTLERATFEDPSIQVFASAQEAVSGTDHILVILADDTAVAEVFFDGERSLIDALSSGQTVLNFGTVRPTTVERLAEALARRGVEVLDVGMLGNSRHARDGELRLYVGGATVDRVPAVLRDLGKEVRHLGPLGSGMKIKLALNLLMGLEMQALAEVVRLGELLGLERSTVLEIISGSGFSAPVMTFKARRMAARRYQAPDFRLALMTKDLGLADQLAMDLGYALPMTKAAYDAHRDACDAGWSDLDCAAIAEALQGRPSRLPQDFSAVTQ
jgi:3-hydroxyisobutyrate dehydrogenase